MGQSSNGSWRVVDCTPKWSTMSNHTGHTGSSALGAPSASAGSVLRVFLPPVCLPGLDPLSNSTHDPLDPPSVIEILRGDLLHRLGGHCAHIAFVLDELPK